MKKLLSAVLIILALLIVTACSSPVPGEFVVTEEYINEKLEKAGLPAYTDKLDKSYAGGTIETEVNYISSLKDKNEPGKTVGLISFNYKEGFCDRFAVSNGLQYKGLENTKKFIDFACDLYGANSKNIADKVKHNFESDENIEYTGLSSVKTGFFENGFHYEFMFLLEAEGDYSLENLTLTTIIITEENKFKSDEERARQARLKLIADNPLLYSDGEPDWPQWKTVDVINSLLSTAKLPFDAEFNYFSKTDIGTANTAYGLYNIKGEQAGTISTVRFVSGYQYSVIQNVLDVNGFITRMSTEDMLKVACGISGAEYTEDLLKIVNDFKRTNELSVYFEYDGCYWHVGFSSLYANYRYLHSITVNEPDVLKGRLLSWINSAKQNGMDFAEDQEVYDRFFG